MDYEEQSIYLVDHPYHNTAYLTTMIIKLTGLQSISHQTSLKAPLDQTSFAFHT